MQLNLANQPEQKRVRVEFTAKNLPNSVYLYRITACKEDGAFEVDFDPSRVWLLRGGFFSCLFLS